ncbi:Dihydrodipicolinate synthase/N-acetylneuraminate lyase [Devosia enhydra]|uniref:Dihydrodipicolinate synthase/N-acetylneuraminate lyase n=1 Tax=Devosia enhydra TaxID=665118 RepID=A0A1K2I1N5_9HYPH|nr:dihydrodipicolinate synthase family protein [Devosia enhydra]SFZ85668.1 Dihydrodipicolinate synthase/N-acetylneuraminate lyase [Devosia enhydra]
MPLSPALTPSDFATSVVAVPPIALKPDLTLNLEANAALVRHIGAGGVTILLYGGNANLYNFPLGAYGEVLEMLKGFDGPTSRVITSIGPDFGKMLDQAPLIERSGLKNIMLLPMAFPADSHGVGDGVRRIAARLGFGVVLYLKRDMYVRPETLAKLVDEGAVSFVKYAVDRADPAVDAYLDAVIAAIGPERLASGMGETPIADHLGVRGLASYTSGAVCIAPRTAMRLLALYKSGRTAEALALSEPFLAFERLRSELGGIQVLHDAVTLSGLADMGPIMPMVSNVKARHHDRVRAAAEALLAAERQIAG